MLFDLLKLIVYTNMQHKEEKHKLIFVPSPSPYSASFLPRDFAHCFKVNFIFVFLGFLLSSLHISIRSLMERCRRVLAYFFNVFAESLTLKLAFRLQTSTF